MYKVIVFIFFVSLFMVQNYVFDGRKKNHQNSNVANKPVREMTRDRKPSYELTKWGVAGSDAQVELLDDLVSKNYYVIFDGSGSMRENNCAENSTKAQVAKSALRTFAELVPADAQLGLFVFDASGVSERVPLGTQNRTQFMSAVDQVRPGGATPLKKALIKGVETLKSQAVKQRGYGEYSLVVVTDGEASQRQDPREVVEYLFANTPVVVHTIGFCIGENHSLNQPGKTVYGAAQSESELVEGLTGVLAEAESFDLIEFGDE